MNCRKKTDCRFVDIERPLIKYAWDEQRDLNCLERFFKKCTHEIELDLSSLVISHEMDEKIVQENLGDCSVKNRCLFETEFKNFSDHEQKFTFKAERKTTSRYEVTVQEGFKIGGNVNFNIPLTNISGGLTGELQVTKSTGQVFEEVLTWSVDNVVAVGPESGIKAELVIQEIDMSTEFVVRSTIKTQKRHVRLLLKHRRSGEVVEVLFIPSHMLKEIFKHLIIQAKNKAVKGSASETADTKEPTVKATESLEKNRMETNESSVAEVEIKVDESSTLMAVIYNSEPVVASDGNAKKELLSTAEDGTGTDKPSSKVAEYTVDLETKGTLRAVYGAKQFIQINPFKLELEQATEK